LQANVAALLWSATTETEAVAVKKKDRSATIVNPEADEQEARERFWQVAERIRDRNQDKDPDEELEFITRVVEEVREERYERERRTAPGGR
jgi:hypothetical protein